MNLNKYNSITLLCTILFVAGCQSTTPQASSLPREEKVKDTQLFGWPFLDAQAIGIRGGSTQGSPVQLQKQFSDNWISLQMPGITDFERDRRAILSMAGDYRVSFQFNEIAGLLHGYDQPPKPYFSWATERVTVLEDKSDFISLQHTLVMYFEDDEGEVSEPILVKHWRQDWKYEDPTIVAYLGEKRWKRFEMNAAEIQGQWSQSVFQVDDSPRYEVYGKWMHGENLSTWQSNFGKRPMPRREYSVRDDYNLLEGWNTVTITPTGWMHEQSNFKLSKEASNERFVAKEVGINRYEHILAPSLEPAADYWKKTGGYWKAVRDTWAEVYEKYPQFSLRAKVDGEKLYEMHFEYAGAIESAEAYDSVAGIQHARNTIFRFLDFSNEVPSTESSY
jgi:hypothetical protein